MPNVFESSVLSIFFHLFSPIRLNVLPVLPGFAQFRPVSPSFAQFCPVLLSFAQFCSVFLSFFHSAMQQRQTTTFPAFQQRTQHPTSINNAFAAQPIWPLQLTVFHCCTGLQLCGFFPPHCHVPPSPSSRRLRAKRGGAAKGLFSKILTKICKRFEFRAMQKDANLVDLEKCRKMRLCSLS